MIKFASLLRKCIPARSLQKENYRESLTLKNRLLDSIRVMQGDFLKQGIYYGWCKNTLENLLYLSKSEFGFICELLYKKEGTPFIKSHEISNIAWSEENRRFYEENKKKGLEFYNFNSLWGTAITTGKAVIANDPDNDPRRGKYPKGDGHPTLDTFLGIPIKGSSGKVVGVMGVANRPNGYNHELVDFLDPFVSSYGILIEKSQSDKHKKELEEERKSLIKEMEKSLSEIKTLRGILPICSFCKKIRNDKGYWEQVDIYINKYSEADISHSICPECMKKNYPEQYTSIYSDKYK